MKRVLLTGGYGYHDIGDEAQLQAVLENLKTFVPDAHITILSDNVHYTRKLYSEETRFSLNYLIHKTLIGSKIENNSEEKTNEVFNYCKSVVSKYLDELGFLLLSLILILNAKRLNKGEKSVFLSKEFDSFLHTVNISDLLFNVGGGNLTSLWRFDFRCKCLLYIICGVLKKPVILSGQTIGPFYGFKDKLIAKYSINRVNLITLREKYSEKVLRALKITNPLIMVTADNSTALAPADQIIVKKILETEGIDVSCRPLIGINTIGLTYLRQSKETREKTAALLAQLADYMIKKYKATIVFVPTQFGSEDDRVSIIETFNLIHNKAKTVVLTKEYSPKTIKGIISRFDVFVGCRYHSIVFAVNSGVPAFGIYFDEYYAMKIKGILNLVGLEENALDFETLSFENLLSLVETAYFSRKTLTAQLRQVTKILERRSLIGIKYAANLLANTSN